MKRLMFVWVCLLPCLLMAEVKLPAVFSDNMVLQRNEPVKIWGWGNKNEKVNIQFNGQTKQTRANASGKWSVTLDPMQHGGPYTLTVKGKTNTLTLNNILIGDVWLCSGQSNMEWVVANSDNAAKEITEADYPLIRSFNVVKKTGLKPLDDLQGEWTVCSPNTVAFYSAVGYFFARKLHKETGIPIGIINSSWGGTDIETWTSDDSFRTLPQQFSKRYEHVQLPTDYDRFAKENEGKKQAYLQAVENDPGLKEEWYASTTDLSAWKQLEVPKLWSQVGLGNHDGIIWFTYEIELPEDVTGKPGELHLGMIDDQDIAWVNGQKVGSTAGHNIKRIYNLPENLLKKGKNRITVRVHDTGGDGGIYGDAAGLFLKSGNRQYSLAGNWAYREAATNVQYGYIELSPNLLPSLLYNAMIHPIISFAIKGAIWYQGENNAGAAYNYRTLFPLMITDWRTKWGKEFPFYWVQLANFMPKDEQPVESNWAELREAQTMTLSVPRTGEAVIIDIGDAADIHPRNKQDVGLRLALHALHNDYDKKDVICFSPTFESMHINGDKAVINFKNVPGGLVVRNKYGYVEGFAIAGSDKRFYWAKAYVDGDKVIVQCDKVSKPVAVRYGWSNNPDINLYNKAGLPVTPFRTDKQE